MCVHLRVQYKYRSVALAHPSVWPSDQNYEYPGMSSELTQIIRLGNDM